MDENLHNRMTSVLNKMLVRQPDDAEFWFDYMTTNALPAWIRMLADEQPVAEMKPPATGS